MLIVILSFVSFWIDHKSVRLNQIEMIECKHLSLQVPARISVGLLTVLTVTTQSSGNSSYALMCFHSSLVYFMLLGLSEEFQSEIFARIFFFMHEWFLTGWLCLLLACFILLLLLLSILDVLMDCCSSFRYSIAIATSVVHQSHWCLDVSMSCFRLCWSTWICTRQCYCSKRRIKTASSIF